jgi:hypothetical protein
VSKKKEALGLIKNEKIRQQKFSHIIGFNLKKLPNLTRMSPSSFAVIPYTFMDFG